MKKNKLIACFMCLIWGCPDGDHTNGQKLALLIGEQ